MKNTRNNLLPFDVICAAANGNTEALNRVIRHYEGYIARLSMRPIYGESGNPRWRVDVVMRRQLEAKLMAAVLRFRVA